MHRVGPYDDDGIRYIGVARLAELISELEEVVEVDDTILVQVSGQSRGGRRGQQQGQGQQDCMFHPANVAR